MAWYSVKKITGTTLPLHLPYTRGDELERERTMIESPPSPSGTVDVSLPLGE
jgi:hypothetical protein